MSSLIDDAPEGVNTPEFSVSELSGAVKKVVEGEFSHVRVRGEVGRVSRPRSGHVYLDLKDDRAVLAGVIWKGVVNGLAVQPEEGMEVVATGRLTTFPGQSRYQIVIESIAPAGVGALMAMLEKRRKALASEGLFDEDRKQALPYLPRRIGVVTSPSGAVIRDILHRLGERFPVHVTVWPVAVQGDKCAGEVTAAIDGFNALPGALRPDVIIVARGGGSVEDLWGFNEESVVRAAARSTVPLISAVGHETDTTLIDYASDRRAPTPTAAAEMAVPVRAELAAFITDLQGRRIRAMEQSLERRRQRLTDLARALPRPAQLLAERRQRLDLAATRLPSPERILTDARRDLRERALALQPALRRHSETARLALTRVASRLQPQRLSERVAQRRERLESSVARIAPAYGRQQERHGAALTALARTLRTLSYHDTIARGYVVVRGADGTVISGAAGLAAGSALDLQFADGHVSAITGAPTDPATGPAIPPAAAAPKPAPQPAPKPRKPKSKPPGDDSQGSLF